MSTKLNDMICKGLVVIYEDPAFDISLGDPTSSDPDSLVKGNCDKECEMRDDVESDMGFGGYTEGGTKQCQALYDLTEYGKPYCC